MDFSKWEEMMPAFRSKGRSGLSQAKRGRKTFQAGGNIAEIQFS